MPVKNRIILVVKSGSSLEDTSVSYHHVNCSGVKARQIIDELGEYNKSEDYKLQIFEIPSIDSITPAKDVVSKITRQLDLEQDDGEIHPLISSLDEYFQ